MKVQWHSCYCETSPYFSSFCSVQIGLIERSDSRTRGFQDDLKKISLYTIEIGYWTNSDVRFYRRISTQTSEVFDQV